MINNSFTPDTPTNVDLFQRRKFSESLAQSLCLKKDLASLVVAIEGRWGTGKTSIINFIKTVLKSDPSKPIVIDFNPWMTSGTNALVEIMLTQIAAELKISKGGSGAKGVEIAEKILQYAGLLKNLKYIPTMEWAGNIAADSTDAGNSALKTIKEVLPSLSLSQIKKEITTKLSQLNKPIIVIIDDIDRLTHSEIAHLFSAIKCVADFPRITYLLAYDHEQVSFALDKEFGKENGQNYIEKIVQIAYPIPALMPTQMLRFTKDKVEDLFSRLSITLRPFETKIYDQSISIVTGLLKNPRDVVRLVNRLAIAISNTKDNINICDVVVIEALFLKFPHARISMHQQPELFTGKRWISDENGDNTDWTQYLGEDKEKNRNRWRSELIKNEFDEKILTKTIHFLFPRFITNISGQLLINDLRISATDRLQRYFALTSLEGSVEVEEIHELFKNTSLLEEYLDFDEENLKRRLYDIHEYVASASIADFDDVLTIFINKSNSLLDSKILDRAYIEYIEAILIKILKAIPNNRVEKFDKLILELPISIGQKLITTAYRDLGLFKTSNIVESPLIISADDVKKAGANWCLKVKEESTKQSFLDNVDVGFVLWTWWHISENKDFVENLIKSYFQNPLFINKIAEVLLPEEGFNDPISYCKIFWDIKELTDLIQEHPDLAQKYEIFLSRATDQSFLDLMATTYSL